MLHANVSSQNRASAVENRYSLSRSLKEKLKFSFIVYAPKTKSRQKRVKPTIKTTEVSTKDLERKTNAPNRYVLHRPMKKIVGSNRSSKAITGDIGGITTSPNCG